MIISDKQSRRQAILTARRHLPITKRAQANAELRGHVTHLLAHLRPRTLAGYVPMGSEPGGPELVELLAAHCSRLLLPVVFGAQLRWRTYGDALTESPEITGPAESSLAPETIGDADIIVVPALAVDANGTRLGRGGGYYDRALALGSGYSIALLYDEEFGPAVPREEHDRAVAAVITPTGGWRELDLALP